MMPTKRNVTAGLLAAFPLGLLILAAGCSKSQDTAAGPPPGPAMSGPGGGPRGGPGTPIAATASGSEIYQQKCQGCYGNSGQGARGPSLKRAAGRPIDQITQIIRAGHGRMPAFANQLTPAQITLVAGYVKTLPGGAR